VQVTAAADGWCAVPLPAIPEPAAIPEDALVLTRDTELALVRGRDEDTVLALLGARVAAQDAAAAGVLTHLVVLPLTSGQPRRGARPLLVPASRLLVTDYQERLGRAQAGLGARLAAAELGQLAPWLPDAAVEALAAEAVDRAVPSPRARHTILTEVQAGRVSLHGRSELASTEEAAVREVEATPGVVDVVSHLLVDESLTDLVEAALAEKGISGVRALAEHGLISLHGAVPDAATRRKAEDLAARVTGVRGVINRLDVSAAR
jgi:hypothetical protein